MDRPLSTADVPPEFLKAAYLVGHIPRMALATDPRVSYALYVPPHHYNPDPSVSVYGAPASALPKLPLLVSVHGTRRDVSATYYDLIDFADTTPCAILSPIFPSGLDGPNDLGSYKLLTSRTLRSDNALLSMLDEVAQKWPGIDTERVFLMGFSGGGQFVHRFLYLHPERLAAASAGAPGSVTVLDEAKPWPAGTGDVDRLFGKPVRPELIRNVRIQLVVGGADTAVHGGKDFWVWVKRMKEARSREQTGRPTANGTRNGHAKHSCLPPMTQCRLETVQQLKALWEKEGIHAQLDVVEGVAHHARGVREVVLDFLQSQMQRYSPGSCHQRPNYL